MNGDGKKKEMLDWFVKKRYKWPLKWTKFYRRAFYEDNQLTKVVF